MKRRIDKVILVILCLELITHPYSIVFAQETCEDTMKVEMTMETRENSREWRYKVINGKLYRRLFDKTSGKWVGEWEVV